MDSFLEDKPIETLGLSIRAQSCLKQAGLLKVGQVASSSDEELLEILHGNSSTSAEVRNKLSLHLSNSLRLLNLSQQSYKALTQHGIQSVNQLVTMSVQEIRNVPDINTGLLFEVTTRLKVTSVLRTHPGHSSEH